MGLLLSALRHVRGRLAVTRLVPEAIDIAFALVDRGRQVRTTPLRTLVIKENLIMLRFPAAERGLRSEVARSPAHEGHIYDFSMWYGEESRQRPGQFPFDRIPSARLIQAYAAFCEAYGLRPMSDLALLRRIKTAGFEMYRESTGKRQRFYRVSASGARSRRSAAGK